MQQPFHQDTILPFFAATILIKCTSDCSAHTGRPSSFVKSFSIQGLWEWLTTLGSVNVMLIHAQWPWQVPIDLQVMCYILSGTVLQLGWDKIQQKHILKISRAVITPWDREHNGLLQSMKCTFWPFTWAYVSISWAGVIRVWLQRTAHGSLGHCYFRGKNHRHHCWKKCLRSELLRW